MKFRGDFVTNTSSTVGAYFGGGFVVALIESFDVDRTSYEKLIKRLVEKG